VAYVRASLLGNAFLLVAILDYSNSMAVFNSKKNAKLTNKRRQPFGNFEEKICQRRDYERRIRRNKEYA
jgi:hypothetical protein